MPPPRCFLPQAVLTSAQRPNNDVAYEAVIATTRLIQPILEQREVPSPNARCPAVMGFFIWNFPAGLIFLGDGGAYFIGFMLGELALLLVMRNPQVSTWYAVLLLIYPAFETLFSAYRRVFVRGKSPTMPDGIHLHSLIFRRVVQWAVGAREARALMRRNSRTSPYLWMFSLMAVVPATLFWRHTEILICFSLLFVISYVWIYARIVRFKAPRWMILRK